MKQLSVACLCIALFTSAFAGTMEVENLNRGLIAVRSGSGYYLSWRLLANEPYNVGFNIYRGTTLVNTTPITGATNYTDASAAQNSVYTVKAVINGAEQAASETARIISNTEGTNAGYIQVNLQRPPTGSQGGTYSPGDASVGDLDGDGVYEIVLKWDPSNAKDNSQTGVTDNVFLDAYKLDGTHMWRIDLGPNIRAGAHYTQFLVYDFDGDGKAEIMVKTAEGTKDATGAYIKMGPAASANHSSVRRNDGGYILTGPEYLTVFEGLTGKELATANYWPNRDPVNGWGNNESYGNRVDRFNAAVAYVDGTRPTAIFQRGYYGRMTFAAWDWRNKTLTQRWTFDSNASGNSNYAGQGNHQLSVADANNDGRHDIFTGSSVIRHDGVGMWRSGLGHGDALHVAHMIKGTATPQIFQPYESGSVGVSLRQASNGAAVFSKDNSEDVGRGCAAELDPARPGFKFWGSSGMGLYDLTGAVVGNIPNSINHVIWWDGALSRELLNGNKVTKWSVANNSGTDLLTATGYSSVNGTKSNPVLQADIFGDWREEVILSNGSNALRIYTTTMPTTHRLVTLMHDPVYRVAVAWQNSSYNQPPHPGYYIASDMNLPPPTLDVKVIGSTVTIQPDTYIGSGDYIDSLILFDPNNAAAWSINKNLGTGSKIFGDRDFAIGQLPAELQGAPEWISTSMESKKQTVPATIARFKMKQDAKINILYEDRADPKPSWLAAAGFTATTQTVTVPDAEERTFTVYTKEAKKGDVITLGINTNDGFNGCMMYLVAFTENNITAALNKISVNSTFSARVHGKILYVKTSSPTVLDIFDMKGKKVASYNVSTDQTLHLNLQSGMYFAVPRGMQSFKFVAK